MKYGIIRPALWLFDVFDLQFDEALRLIGLERGQVDHSIVNPTSAAHPPGIGIVVHQYGLFVDHKTQSYFAIGPKLYAGPALLYSYDERGNEIDFAEDKYLVQAFLTFFKTADQIEQAIGDGAIDRPTNSELPWAWPQPAPAGMGGQP